MPTNLPPHYYEAERRYRSAKTIPERVAALQEMMSATPKHKGTDHLRADMRSRMARLMEDLEKPRQTGGGQSDPFSIRKEGAGQAALVGLPNGGKSQLLASLTGANAKVAAYPFTTQLPQPGMLPYQNVRIQMIDTPAINDQDMQTRLFSLLRNTDILLIVIDLSADALGQMEQVVDDLERWGFLLLGKDEMPDPEEHRVQKRVVVAGNKADEEGALDQYQELDKGYGDRFPVVMVSTLEEVGLDELKEAVFKALDKVRVYTKAPDRDPDYSTPIVLAHGSRVEDAAEALHKDWRRRLRYAVLWGSGKFEAQRVGRGYVLADGDVIEFHG
jgi:ribosome-interacting GTPase 1